MQLGTSAYIETWSYSFEEEGGYTCICTPHPYMEGKVTVRAAERSIDVAAIVWPMIPAVFAQVIAIAAKQKKED